MNQLGLKDADDIIIKGFTNINAWRLVVSDDALEISKIGMKKALVNSLGVRVGDIVALAIPSKL